MTVVPRVLTLLIVTAAGAWTAVVGRAAESALVLQVASGRVFSGALDASSTNEELVLRSGRDGVTLLRPIRWERIVKATADRQPVGIEALREAASRARQQGTGDRGQALGVAGTVAQRGSRKSGVRRIELRGPAPEEHKSEPPPASPPPPVTSISFDAFVANWDADVETDGLVIDLAPLDANGYLVPTEGTLEVELFAPQRRVFDQAPRSGGDTLELVERWTRSIAPADMGPSGYRVRLPFGAIHPELSPDWLAWWYGLVHVRLAVPGDGVFDDSRDGVRVRPWAPNRDQLEMNTGRRFLPTENLGRRN